MQWRKLPSYEAGCSDAATAWASGISPLSRKQLCPVALKIQQEAASLPVRAVGKQIQESICDNPVTFVQADTGAGKTTQVGQLAAEMVSDVYHETGKWMGQVIVAMPTKGGVHSAATWVAKECDVSFGKYLAVRTRAWCAGNDDASLMFMTLGYLSTQLKSGVLDRAAVVILDEIQSRKESHSFIVPMLKSHLAKKADARVVLMGAEDDHTKFEAYFAGRVGIVRASGRRFTVTRWCLPALPQGCSIDDDTC